MRGAWWLRGFDGFDRAMMNPSMRLDDGNISSILFFDSGQYSCD